jgi:hypothetical protein
MIDGWSMGHLEHAMERGNSIINIIVNELRLRLRGKGKKKRSKFGNRRKEVPC